MEKSISIQMVKTNRPYDERVILVAIDISSLRFRNTFKEIKCHGFAMKMSGYASNEIPQYLISWSIHKNIAHTMTAIFE